MSRRKLRPEEKELWQKVTHSATPLPQALRRAAEPVKPTVRPKVEPEIMDLPKAFGIGAKANIAGPSAFKISLLYSKLAPTREHRIRRPRSWLICCCTANLLYTREHRIRRPRSWLQSEDPTGPCSVLQL